MSSPLVGNITASGIAGAVAFPMDTSDTMALLEISGAYTGAQLVFEALPRASSKWLPISGYSQDQQAYQLGTPGSPISVVDGSTLGWKFDGSLYSSFRVWAAALTTGPVVVNWSSGSFYGSPPGGPAGGLTTLTAILWQLQELTRVTAAGLGQTATPNPVLPLGLPATISSNF